MKMTLLELTQDILNDMDSDSVNSIFDTFESEQVAQIIKTTYFSLMSTREWPHLRQTIQLVPSTDQAKPTHMYVPDGVMRMVSLNYNKARDGETRKLYQNVSWREPDHFLQMTNAQNSDSDNIDVIMDDSGIELLIANDRHPTYFTSFDDKTLIFNSYDKSVDDTLQNSKTQALAYVMPDWQTTDTFVPDLPEEAFMALLEEAKSRAMVKLKQIEDPKSEQEAQRQHRWLSRNSWKVKGGIKTPNYGRNSRKMRRDPTFTRNDY